MCIAVAVPEDFLVEEGLLKDGEFLVSVAIHRSGNWDVAIGIKDDEKTLRIIQRWLKSDDAGIHVEEEFYGFFPIEKEANNGRENNDQEASN